MFDADVDPFFNVPISHALVDDDPDGGFGHVVDDTRFTVIDFVWHAWGSLEWTAIEAWYFEDRPFLDGTIGFDVDNITNPTGL